MIEARCRHVYCRNKRAEELCQQADATGNDWYVAEAVALHQRKTPVRCRIHESRATPGVVYAET